MWAPLRAVVTGSGIWHQVSAMQTLGGSSNGQHTCSPTTPVGNLNCVPNAWPVATENMCGVNQQPASLPSPQWSNYELMNVSKLPVLKIQLCRVFFFCQFQTKISAWVFLGHTIPSGSVQSCRVQQQREGGPFRWGSKLSHIQDTGVCPQNLCCSELCGADPRAHVLVPLQHWIWTQRQWDH